MSFTKKIIEGYENPVAEAAKATSGRQEPLPAICCWCCRPRGDEGPAPGPPPGYKPREICPSCGYLMGGLDWEEKS